MGMWRVRGRINPKTQVQKPNPGAPSASLEMVRGLIWDARSSPELLGYASRIVER